MFGSLGFPEILFILVLGLLIFGPKRLPEVGRTLGKGLREFRRATTDLKRSVEVEMSQVDLDDRPRPRAAPPPETVSPPAPVEERADTANDAAGDAVGEPTESESDRGPQDASPERGG
jgi:TatA/E family protein of Tat protein translocase